MDNQKYDRDYFEHGIQTGVSLYENYRWLPELTKLCAQTLVAWYRQETGSRKERLRVFDFGCAKGFIVRALCELGHEAWGCDISGYAVIENPDEVAKPRLRLLELPRESEVLAWMQSLDLDLVISKDVFEHIEEDHLPGVFRNLSSIAPAVAYVVPLGDGNGAFVAPEYELDVTHRVRRGRSWWEALAVCNGFKAVSGRFVMPGIKDNWAKYPEGNGFFFATR